MGYRKVLQWFCLFLLFVSCAESLDFNQLNNYKLKPIFSGSFTYFTVTAADFFDATGTISQTTISQTANFDLFRRQVVKDNLVKLDFNIAAKNEFDRGATIIIEFLNANKSPVYTLNPIVINRNNQNFKYLEAIDIVANPQLFNTTQVKITVEIENTGLPLNINSAEKFEFQSSVTLYVEANL